MDRITLILLALVLVVSIVFADVSSFSGSAICGTGNCDYSIAKYQILTEPLAAQPGHIVRFQLTVLPQEGLKYESLSSAPRLLWKGVGIELSETPVIAMRTEGDRIVAEGSLRVPAAVAIPQSSHKVTGLENLSFTNCEKPSDDCQVRTTSLETVKDFLRDTLAQLGKVLAPEAMFTDVYLIIEAAARVAHQFRFEPITPVFVITGPVHQTMIGAVAITVKHVCPHCRVLVPQLPHNMDVAARKLRFAGIEGVEVVNTYTMKREPVAFLLDTTTIMDAAEEATYFPDGFIAMHRYVVHDGAVIVSKKQANRITDLFSDVVKRRNTVNLVWFVNHPSSASDYSYEIEIIMRDENGQKLAHVSKALPSS